MNKQNRQKNEFTERALVKDKIIQLGSRQMLRNQITSHSYLSLFFSTIKFVRTRMWIAQLLVIGLSLFLLGNSRENVDFESLIKGLTVLIFFSVIFFIDELFKSFTCGMWELEQTFKYDLRQHISMKLIIFGVFDLLLILLLSLLGGQIFPVSLLRFALFLLVPFNIICIVLFSIFTIMRNHFSSLVLWGCAGGLVAGAIIISSLFDIYIFPASYWLLAYILTGFSLASLIRVMLKRQITGGLVL